MLRIEYFTNLIKNLHFLSKRYIRLIEWFCRYSRIIQGKKALDKRTDTMIQAFQYVNNLLKSGNINYWITDGTLLGFHRDQALLENDNDIDFAILEIDSEKLYHYWKNSSPNLPLFYSTFRHNGPTYYTVFKGYKVDIYSFREVDNYLISNIKHKFLCYMQPIRKDFVFPLVEKRFLDCTVKTPNLIENYLTHFYNYIGSEGIQCKKTGYWYQNQRVS